MWSSDVCIAWLFSNLKIDCLTLDLDSTVMTRYGRQEGVARGYNPAKWGRPSRHPLMAFLADVQRVANLWLRPEQHPKRQQRERFLKRDTRASRREAHRVAAR